MAGSTARKPNKLSSTSRLSAAKLRAPASSTVLNHAVANSSSKHVRLISLLRQAVPQLNSLHAVGTFMNSYIVLWKARYRFVLLVVQKCTRPVGDGDGERPCLIHGITQLLLTAAVIQNNYYTGVADASCVRWRRKLRPPFTL